FLEPGKRWHHHPDRRSIEQHIHSAVPQHELPDEGHGGHGHYHADQSSFQLVQRIEAEPVGDGHGGDKEMVESDPYQIEGHRLEAQNHHIQDLEDSFVGYQISPQRVPQYYPETGQGVDRSDHADRRHRDQYRCHHEQHEIL